VHGFCTDGAPAYWQRDGNAQVSAPEPKALALKTAGLGREAGAPGQPLSLEYSSELKYTVTNENGSNPEQHHFGHPNKSVPSGAQVML